MKSKVLPIAIIGVIVVAAVTRIIPHYPNVTALGAAALFGGAYFSRKWALAVPVIALFLSNLFLDNVIYSSVFPENYEGFVWFQTQSLWVYGAFIVMALLGMFLLQKKSALRIAGTSVLGSALFFLISNTGVWLGSSMYEISASGLVLCFTEALPYFWNTLFGDLFYVGVFFGAYALYEAWATRRALMPVPDKE